MKKYISMMAIAVALTWGFTACDVETDEEPGGVNIQNMCGYWDVSVSQIDESGNVVYEPEELFGLVDIPLFTYNTASNSTTEMWIDDQGEFWDFKFKVPIDYAASTFHATDVCYNDDMRAIADAIAAGQNPVDDEGNPLTPEKATITEAKIMLGAAKNLHGKVCDSISFVISFTDDSYAAKYGYAKHRVSGVRHTGFTE